MRKLLVDTNIVLDLLAKREPFYESAARVFTLADKQKLVLGTSSMTIVNTHYVLSRLSKPGKARETLRKFKLLVQILALNEKIVALALNDDGFADFEDGLQYYTAIEHDQEVIITRDLKGFRESKIPVMTAEEYLTSIKEAKK